jgi:hypothetical protein
MPTLCRRRRRSQCQAKQQWHWPGAHAWAAARARSRLAAVHARNRDAHQCRQDECSTTQRLSLRLALCMLRSVNAVARRPTSDGQCASCTSRVVDWQRAACVAVGHSTSPGAASHHAHGSATIDNRKPPDTGRGRGRRCLSRFVDCSVGLAAA